jgi:hypothetical protein
VPDHPGPDHSPGKWAAAVVAAVVCCAGPPLLLALGVGAGGTAVGAALGNPLVFIPAVVILTVAVVHVVGRRRC